LKCQKVQSKSRKSHQQPQKAPSLARRNIKMLSCRICIMILVRVMRRTQLKRRK